MSVSLTTNEEAQLSQTIEMFEVITQSQPLDYQSLEILKEAYAKLGRQKEMVRTSKRIAEAYMLLGQLSSAILEYEGILQRFPDDPDVRKALADIELKASNVAIPRPAFAPEERAAPPVTSPARKSERSLAAAVLEDGRQPMRSLFVDGKYVSEADFTAYWPSVDMQQAPKHPTEPFIEVLAERQIVPIEVSLKLIVEKARLGYLPLEKYDVDVELARGFPRDVCLRWCILPFDRMSKSFLIATANPFNKQAAQDLAAHTKGRLLWYVASPAELLKILRKVFR